MALTALACEELDPGDETYCDTLGSGVAPCNTDPDDMALSVNNWECLDQAPPTLPPPRPPTSPVGFLLPVVEWGSLQPLAGLGLTVNLCLTTSFACATQPYPPYTTVAGSLGGMPLPPQAAGAAAFPVYEGFDGFLKFDVAAPAVPDGAPEVERFVPLTYYLGGTVSGDTQGPPLLMLRRGDLNTVVEQLRVNPETTQTAGTLIVGAYDCDGAPVRDARIEINAPAAGLVKFQLSLSRIPFVQPEGQPLYTGSSGLAGFLNVAPGAVHVDVYRRGDTEPFGTGDVGVVAGQITVGPMRPAFLNDANLAGARIADATTTPTTTP